jgi:long-chain acyl-CoA synthetase
VTRRPWLDQYDYWVPPTLNPPKRPLTEILDSTALELPDHRATAFLGSELTFAEIKRRSDALAAALSARGIQRGDRVGIMLPNCPQYMIAAFAVLRVGAIVVNLNPSFTAPEALNVFADSGMRALVTLDKVAPLVGSVQPRTSIALVILTSLSEYSVGGPPAAAEGSVTLAQLIGEGADAPVPRVRSVPDDLAVLQYTGGTTGTPKAAMLSHGNIFANVVQSETWYHRAYVRGEDRYLLVIPYFHIYAFTVGMMCGVWIGALQILLPRYDVEQVLDAIRHYRPTYFPAVPTIYVSLLAHPHLQEYGLEHVRRFNSGAAPCPVAVLEEFERRVGRPLNQGYGLTETSPVTHAQPLLGARRYGTIGLPVPSTDIKVVDVETGACDLGFGEEGELCISGPQVMQGYWNNPEETAQVLRVHDDGRTWLHTGDIARIDEDGFTTIVQRKKDMIIVNGFNVFPSDVERVLHQHPAVRLAAVIGLPHHYHGEVVKAYVVLREGHTVTRAELDAHCAASLTEYKRPCEFEFRESLPMSAVGKILYRVLRDEERQRSSAPETR